jgi:Na+/H+ antiporter NhaC
MRMGYLTKNIMVSVLVITLTLSFITCFAIMGDKHNLHEGHSSMTITEHLESAFQMTLAVFYLFVLFVFFISFYFQIKDIFEVLCRREIYNGNNNPIFRRKIMRRLRLNTLSPPITTVSY